VLVNGRRLARSSWDYRPGEQVFGARFAGARVKLTVVGRAAARCG
jgi:hypothetical protein